METSPKKPFEHFVITGASSGIGLEIAKRMALAGTNLTLISRSKDKLLNAVSGINNPHNVDISAVALDVCDAAAMEEFLLERQQQKPFTGIFTNAGINTSQAKQRFSNINEIEQQLVNVHFNGMLNTINPILPFLKKQHYGRILLMSSMNAFINLPTSSIYGAMKTAILHYGRCLQLTLGSVGIKVQIICPGFVDTPLTQTNKFKMPLLMKVEQAGDIIMRGFEQQKPEIIFPKTAYYSTMLLKLLPNKLRLKLTS